MIELSESMVLAYCKSAKGSVLKLVSMEVRCAILVCYPYSDLLFILYS